MKEFGESNLCILLVGNKCDLDNIRQVSIEEVTKKAEQYGVGFCETSALNSKNVNFAFQELIKLVSQKNSNNDDKYGNKSNVISTGVSLDTKIIAEEKRPKKSNNCC